MIHLRSLVIRGALSVVVGTSASAAFADADSPWIYKFEDGQASAAGRTPVGALLSDSGRLYGVTFFSGTENVGTFYEAEPDASATWTHSALFDFTQASGAGAIGFSPAGGVIKGTDGGFYGMTTAGLLGAGGLYRLAVTEAGVKKKLLHSFDPAVEGNAPTGELTVDARGNLFGILAGSAQPGATGATFELEKHGKNYVFHILHAFGLVDGDGQMPLGRLAIDGAGNLYGTTKYGGKTGNGTVYRISSISSGAHLTILHSFSAGRSVYPVGGVSLDATGALVGSTGSSDVDSGQHLHRTAATVFRMTTNGKSWNYTDVYQASVSETISAPVDAAADGRLTTATSTGRIFQLTPSAAGGYAMQTLGDVSSYDSSVLFGLAYSADGHQVFGTSPVAFEDDDFNVNGAIFSVAH